MRITCSYLYMYIFSVCFYNFVIIIIWINTSIESQPSMMATTIAYYIHTNMVYLKISSALEEHQNFYICESYVRRCQTEVCPQLSDSSFS